MGHFIVKPSSIEILEQDGTNRLTLMACHPKYSAAQRIVVTATLVSNPAPATPRPPPVPTPGRVSPSTPRPTRSPVVTPSAWPTAIAWTLVALAVWFLMWLAGHLLYGRYHRRIWQLPAYVIGIPIVVVLLFLAFQDIARLLPAAY